jgi:peptidoglycan/xylan/chitin deacetylase (PgdA/CDA1 family)
VSSLLGDECPLLTFDDGPSESTGEILDLLAAYGINNAIFYVIGLRAAQRPDLVTRAAAEGHTVGNYTWDHVGSRSADGLLRRRRD